MVIMTPEYMVLLEKVKEGIWGKRIFSVGVQGMKIIIIILEK